MSCKSTQARLSAYIDGELAGCEMLEVRAHLMSCPCCLEEYESLRALKSLLCGLRVPDPSPDFEERLVAGLTRPTVQSEDRSLKTHFGMFVGVMACSMALTLAVMTEIDRRTEVAKQQKSSKDIRFEVQRDQAYSVSADPYSGMPTLSPTSYDGR